MTFFFSRLILSLHLFYGKMLFPSEFIKTIKTIPDEHEKNNNGGFHNEIFINVSRLHFRWRFASISMGGRQQEEALNSVAKLRRQCVLFSFKPSCHFVFVFCLYLFLGDLEIIDTIFTSKY